MCDRLSESTELQQITEIVVDNPAIVKPTIADLLTMQVSPPTRQDRSTRAMEGSGLPRTRNPRFVNYLEREARNRALGRAGEEIVVRFEQERLWRAGEKRLAERIEHVSATQGDGLGYDVLSFETSGRERLIEAKTTQFGASTPFFVSANEVAVSDQRADAYHLYRLYDFRAQARLFILDGALAANCDLQATQFRARID